MTEIRTKVWDEDSSEFVEIVFDLSSQPEMGQTYSVSEQEVEPTLYGPNQKPIVKPRHQLGFHR